MLASQSSVLPNSLMVTVLGAWWDRPGVSVSPCSAGSLLSPEELKPCQDLTPFPLGQTVPLCSQAFPLFPFSCLSPILISSLL